MRRLVGLGRQHVVVLALERARPRLLEIVVDRGSGEAFANGGRVAFTDLMLPPRDADRVAVSAQRGQAKPRARCCSSARAPPAAAARNRRRSRAGRSVRERRSRRVHRSDVAPRDATRVAVFAQRGRATLSGLTAAQLRAGDDTTDDSAPR
ncbi:GH32 C-terminal domain-containing protein [Burkholderia dolosa]|uniref:GH32 C-terminal domain-containing protein n=1 Tax=Burkholderia dolosa TaxID=152500 RepID=UPI003F9D2DD0